jgi:hypothetical protein
MENSFRFFLGADISKSDDSEGRRIIKGYASTETEDRQGETLIQKGLDISNFIDHGWFNYDHDNSIILGYPLETCRVDNKGFWVEGELLKGVTAADRMWDLAVALKKSNAPRKIGFSIEGKVEERDGNRIVKAKIYNVAITPNPVNTTCSWDAIVKSFSSDSGTVVKALEAGYQINPLEMEGGDVFRKEDLEKQIHNLSYVIGDDEKKKILKQKLSTKKSLSSNEIALYLQITQGWSYKESIGFVDKYVK